MSSNVKIKKENVWKYYSKNVLEINLKLSKYNIFQLLLTIILYIVSEL
jgi:hypothetical protein